MEEQEILKEIKITKKANPSASRFDYIMAVHNVDPDELVGILTRILEGVKSGKISPGEPTDKPTKCDYFG